MKKTFRATGFVLRLAWLVLRYRRALRKIARHAPTAYYGPNAIPDPMNRGYMLARCRDGEIARKALARHGRGPKHKETR